MLKVSYYILFLEKGFYKYMFPKRKTYTAHTSKKTNKTTLNSDVHFNLVNVNQIKASQIYTIYVENL